jgi:hypothetical protein
MRPSHREIISYETGWRLESLLRRFAGVTRLYPRLAPGVSHASVRRTINRLRSGATHSLEPDTPRTSSPMSWKAQSRRTSSSGM